VADASAQMLHFSKLSGEDKIAFDSLMNKAREHASYCTVTPMLEPMDAVFLSILGNKRKRLSHCADHFKYSQIIRAFSQVIFIPIPATSPSTAPQR